MIQRKSPIMTSLGGGAASIPSSGGGGGGGGLGALIQDIVAMSKQQENQPQYNIETPKTFDSNSLDPYSFYTHGANIVSGQRNGDKSNNPFIKRLLGGGI